MDDLTKARLVSSDDQQNSRSDRPSRERIVSKRNGAAMALVSCTTGCIENGLWHFQVLLYTLFVALMATSTVMCVGRE